MATHTTTDTLLLNLKEIPCSFNLKINGLTQPQAKNLLEKLQREYECQEYDYFEEKRRYFNLMTYLHYFCRQLEAAHLCNSEALKMDPESIVSLANQACVAVTKIAAKLSTNRVKRIEAMAEIAYSYARFGIKYYKEAEKRYQNALDEVTVDDSMPSFLWQYGHGLIIRRKLRFHGKEEEYKRDVKKAADLLYKVARQDKIFRFKARAWVELGNLSFLAKKYCTNWHTLFPDEIANFSEDDMFSKAVENIIKVNDVPALEHYAMYLKRRSQYKKCEEMLQQSVAVKESSRAYQSLAKIKMAKFLNKRPTQEPPPKCVDYNEEVLKILSDYNSAIRLQTNYSAMACKVKFLYRIGQFEDAIDVLKTIYSFLQRNDSPPENLNRYIPILCPIYHAKCLLGLSRDDSAIIQATHLLRSAIEMSFELQRKRLGDKELERYRIKSDHNNDDEISQDDNKLPRKTVLQKLAIEDMKQLLQNEKRTTESIIEEIALCELIKDEDRLFELCSELENRGIGIDKPIDFAKELIKDKDFDKGLFLLKLMILSDQLPEEAMNFTVTSQVDGAMDALKKGDSVLAGTRLRDAFNVRFRDEVSTDSDILHVFFVAHECNRDITWKLQRIFYISTKLNITSCFDATPVTSKLDNLEVNLQNSYVIAVLMDINDLKNDDFETDIFKTSIRMAQCTQMKHNRSKALVAVQLSEQVDISNVLSDARHVLLQNELKQDDTMFLHDFFMQALLN
ncbi:hypothetical protein ACJMK2_031832 [Sinanodonta woodiana]|uniref:Uncharacterized protein n=1 Tax=Sinanodonta woodiana TaxID=1069815 RepID=A0ABD3X3Y3_SINWO